MTETAGANKAQLKHYPQPGGSFTPEHRFPGHSLSCAIIYRQLSYGPAAHA